MKLVVGLGNPGKEYANTYHNLGFDVLDILAKKVGASINKSKGNALYAQVKIKDEIVFLIKPLTYMNLSGQSVMEIAHFYKIPTENILVIFDDMDTPPGKIRLREKGSAGGQKGMQSIIQMMHTDVIKRIKVGIGPKNMDVVSYVLGVPSDEDKELIEKAQVRAIEAIEAYIKKGFGYAQSRYC